MNREDELAALIERMSKQLAASEEQLHITTESQQTKINRIEAKLDANTEMTKGLLDLFATLTGGFKVLGWLGSIAKWIAGVGIAAGVIYGWLHDMKINK